MILKELSFAITFILVLISMYLISELLMSGRYSLIARLLSRISGINRRENLAVENTLFKCTRENCNRLFRYYQARLHETSKGFMKCPHCENGISLEKVVRNRHLLIASFKSVLKISEEDMWMATHPDCPKINHRELKKLDETIQQLKRAKAEEEELKRFEEYNKISVDLKWIENIQKGIGIENK